MNYAKEQYMLDIITLLADIADYIEPYASKDEKIASVISTYKALSTTDIKAIDGIIETLEELKDEEEEAEEPNEELLDMLCEALQGLDHWLDRI